MTWQRLLTSAGCAAALAAVLQCWQSTAGAQDLETAAVEKACTSLPEPAERVDYLTFAACEAKKHRLPAEVAHAVIEIESNFQPLARGGDGEVGLMQVMPSTAHLLGFRGTLEDLANPAVNIRLGVRYLSQAWNLAGRDLCTTVMKYRAGHNETRFSHLSVQYCLKARTILKRAGYEVTGTVPEATFGFAASSGKGGACLRRSFVPGPGYGRCLSSSNTISSARAVAIRRSIFGG